MLIVPCSVSLISARVFMSVELLGFLLLKTPWCEPIFGVLFFPPSHTWWRGMVLSVATFPIDAVCRKERGPTLHAVDDWWIIDFVAMLYE